MQAGHYASPSMALLPTFRTRGRAATAPFVCCLPIFSATLCVRVVFKSVWLYLIQIFPLELSVLQASEGAFRLSSPSLPVLVTAISNAFFSQLKVYRPRDMLARSEPAERDSSAHRREQNHVLSTRHGSFAKYRRQLEGMET